MIIRELSEKYCFHKIILIFDEMYCFQNIEIIVNLFFLTEHQIPLLRKQTN